MMKLMGHSTVKVMAMERLSNHEVLIFCLALFLLLGVGRIFAMAARRLQQPAVLGEIIAGILLGPTVLGTLSPNLSHTLFPMQGHNAIALEALTTFGIILFLLVAGMEVDLAMLWKQGRSAMAVGMGGMLIPFALGFGSVWLFPSWFQGETPSRVLLLALFFATALSISALPVIAKTLMDLALYRSDLGMVVIAAAILNDLIGWVIFAILLGMMDVSRHIVVSQLVLFTLLYVGVMLTLGRMLLNRSLLWLNAHTQGPGAFLSFAIGMALLGAAFTDWIGIHAIFGAFVVGVALGDSAHLLERNRQTLSHFISFILAPLFFTTIGLKVNFVAHFDLGLTVVVFVIACAGKLLGGGLAAYWSGFGRRESIAIGAGLNARGAMEIILGMLALQYHLIDERMFVALVIMALLTSMMAGTLIQWSLQQRQRYSLTHYLDSRTVLLQLQANSRDTAIRELSHTISLSLGIDAEVIEQQVVAQERLVSTGLGDEVAVPHAKIAGLLAPRIGIGISPLGLDFDAPDARKAHIIILVLTPLHEEAIQWQIFADIAKIFGSEESRQKAMHLNSYTELLALIRTALDH